MEKYQKIELILVVIILILILGFFIYVFDVGGISGFVLLGKEDLKAPSDFITEDKIIADKDKVIIKIENSVLSRYTSSESMVPIFASSATGIGFKPEAEGQIHIGDIVSFKQRSEMIVHRVIKRGEDESGGFFVTRGDNNNFDDKKIRFEDIDSVLVAIVY